MTSHPLQRRGWLKACAAAALGLAGVGAHAQAPWPNKPIRLIVPAPAGGGQDAAARALGERLTAILGQQIIIENKAGAAGIIATAELLKSPRDGYTFLMNLNSIASEIPHVVKMPFDPFVVLRPLAEVARFAMVFAANPQVPANDLAGFISHARANAGKLNYASYSAGTISHTLGLQLSSIAGLDMVHVPYKGSPPALQDLMGGQVQVMFDASSNVMPFARAGRLKVYATTAAQRLSLMPDVPTFAELGYPDLTEIGWVGIWTTPDLPVAIQNRMREAIQRALQEPKLRDLFTGTFGWTMGTPATPEELITRLRAASDKQAAMLKAIGFKPE
jgi:tripartite-type tricarboxylate transporter receptor subunit TctC